MKTDMTATSGPELLSNFPTTRSNFWHSQTMTIARFTLLIYLKSAWSWGELIFVVSMAGVLFKYPGDLNYYAGVANGVLCFTAFVGTAILVHRSVSARLYLPLSRLSSRAAYMRGVIIAAAGLRIPLYLAFQASALALRGITGANFENMLIAALGGITLSIVTSVLTATFSPPQATRLARIILLAWFAVMLYSSTSAPLAAVIEFTRIPLAPLAACYTATLTGVVTFWTLLGFVLSCGYMLGLTWLASHWLGQRDLILH
jgi:hypothetical protein